MSRATVSKKGFSLRLRLMLLVAAELVISILVALGLYVLLLDLVPLAPTVLLFLMLLFVSLTVGMLITNFLSKIIFAPIQQLTQAMEMMLSLVHQAK